MRNPYFEIMLCLWAAALFMLGTTHSMMTRRWRWTILGVFCLLLVALVSEARDVRRHRAGLVGLFGSPGARC